MARKLTNEEFLERLERKNANTSHLMNIKAQRKNKIQM